LQSRPSGSERGDDWVGDEDGYECERGRGCLAPSMFGGESRRCARQHESGPDNGGVDRPEEVRHGTDCGE
jgi:hypothetical protein